MDAPSEAATDPRGGACRPRHEFLAFGAVLLALEILFFADALRPERVLSAADWLLATQAFRDVAGPGYEPANRLLTDIATQNDPWLRAAADQWAERRVPLWTPYAGCGAPLLANAQSGVFFPPHFLYFLTRSPRSWVVLGIMKLWLAGAGAFLFARSLKLGPVGRWFAGLCFPFSGFLVVWLQYALASVAALFPLVLWRTHKLVERPGAWSAGWLAAVVALVLLGGHPETAAHILLVTATYTAWRLWHGASPRFEQSSAARPTASGTHAADTPPCPRLGKGGAGGYPPEVGDQASARVPAVQRGSPDPAGHATAGLPSSPTLPLSVPPSPASGLKSDVRPPAPSPQPACDSEDSPAASGEANRVSGGGARGDLRSGATAGSGDPRRTADPRRVAALAQPARVLGWFAVSLSVAVLVAAVQLLPLADYLAQSRVWLERSRRVPRPLELVKPELLAMPALAAPYYLGSYRRGHPHVEKALGVDNFNEIAGGYAGLTTLAVLIPLALAARRRHRWIGFWLAADLVALAVIYRFPVMDNLVRLVPVLRLAHNQRLLLVVALAHALVGGAGLEAWPGWLACGARGRVWAIVTLTAAALALAAAALAVRSLAPGITARATERYRSEAAARGLAAEALADRAERQAQRTVAFFPRYYAGVAAYAALLAGLLAAARRIPAGLAQHGLFAMTLIDLFVFGRNYNPAIPAADYLPTCSIVEFLRAQPGPFRVLPLDEEFPPNVLAVYGICDARNYDSIELRGSLDFFQPLWHGRGRLTSNAWTPWDRVLEHVDLLARANIRYVISTAPPPQHESRVSLAHRSGPVGVYRVGGAAALLRLEPSGRAMRDTSWSAAAGMAVATPEPKLLAYHAGDIEAGVAVPEPGGRLVVSESWMRGWQAWVDGKPTAVEPVSGAWIGVPLDPGEHHVRLLYRPASFAVGAALGAFGVVALGGLLLGGCLVRRGSPTPPLC